MEEKKILRRLSELKTQVPEGTTVEDLLQKAAEREEGMEGKGEDGERRQIGVHMDIALWWKFKEQAARERLSAGQLLERLVREYMEKAEEGKE